MHHAAGGQRWPTGKPGGSGSAAATGWSGRTRHGEEGARLASRCLYCAAAIRGELVVDHFVPWARYPFDLGHNYVLTDARCNGEKADRLAAFDHLSRWCERNGRADWTDALERRLVPHDASVTRRVATWAYRQAERAGATVWERGRDGMVGLDPRWRSILAG